jgi:predicted enzyme related to lactoylglutathione lyase
MDPVGRLTDITIDACDVPTMAAFWGAVLGVEQAHRFGPYTNLEPLPGGLVVGFQQVAEPPPPGKVRLHLDVRVEDLEEAVGRVVELGGRHVEDVAELGQRWAVMADPEGNAFCLLGPRPG